MNVAFVVGGFPSLSETFILNQITGLLAQGVGVEIFAQFNPNDRKIHRDVDRYGLDRKVSYFPKIPANRIIRLLKGLWLFFSHFLENPGRIIRCLDVWTFGRDALSLKILYYNIPLLKKKFDILHCHFGQIGIIGGFLKKTGAGEKLITTFHGYDLSEFLQLNGQDVYHDLFRICDLCMPVSYFWKDRLIELGCEKEKIKVHRMGIHVESFRFREREIKRDGRINILTIGRLVEKKGHEYAIRAMAKVIKRFPRVRYLIAGGGPLMKPLKDQSKNLGIDRQVRFYGECNQDEVVKLYELAHIFLLPSVTSSQGDQEGIPMVLMEAQAVGLPIVSTCHSGIPEGIRNGESGFLVSEKNVDAIADRIYYLIEHPRKCGRMGREGRRWIENEFDQKKLDSRLIQFYECLLKVNTP